ncbi:MAG: TIGR03086 family protein, partial [Dehalococcoidia bacterium]
AYNRSMEVASQAALEPGAMGRTTHLSFGDCPGSEYAKQLFLDLLVHGWDVAKGSGQDAQLDPVLVEAALPIAEEMAAMAESMGVGVFGSPQALPEEANPQARLLGILGRRDD